MKNSIEKNIWLALRLTMGWIMLWAFFDKLFGLGFATASDQAWIAGTSPTLGFLKFGTSGPFSAVFQSMAGNFIVDWLFMLGLLLIGLALIINFKLKIAGYAGALMMFFMWLAVLPPEHNPLIDEHIIYIIIFIGIANLDYEDKRTFLNKWLSK